MRYNGRDLNFRALWEELGVSVPEHETGSFSSLLYCPHPNHENKRSPAFQVNMMKPLCNCFGANCFGSAGEPGTIEYAVQVIRRCDEKEARKFIMRFTRAALGVEHDFVGKGLRKTFTGDSAIAGDMLKLERGEFTYLPKQARAYLDARGVDNSARGTWQIGWCEQTERLVFPAFDHQGKLRFLIRRSIDDRRPKYLYTDGAIKKSLLFGLLRRPASQRILVLVEGSIDTIALHQGGTTAAVGTLGSGLSDQQVRLIDRADPEAIYCMYDRDAAGVANVIDAQKKLSRYPLFVCRYRVGGDPAEVSGSEAERMLERAIPIHEFARKLATLTPRRKKELV